MFLEEFRDRLHKGFDGVLAPLARALARIGASPNHVTVFAVALAAVAALLVVAGHPVLAGIVWLSAGVLDLLDGAMARLLDKVTEVGAFLDSTLDRVSEGLLLAAIGYRFAVQGEAVYVAVTVLALLGSVLVSYTRARAEALGVRCQVGLASRGERVVFLGVALLFDLLGPVVLLLAILAATTVVQRIAHVLRELDHTR